MQLIVTENYQEMSSTAGEIVKALLKEKPNAVLGLPTGSTPVGMYAELVKAYQNGEISFENVTTVNLDEYVGLWIHRKQSYRCFMKENLFSHVNLPRKNTYIPCGNTLFLQKECERYNQVVDENPIDLQILGIGENGHLGFNEPNTPFSSRTHVTTLSESTRQANSRFFDEKTAMPKRAITMGIADILGAKTILLLASGAKKAEAVKQMLEGDCCEAVPASALQRHANVIVVADKEAVSLLSAETREAQAETTT